MTLQLDSRQRAMLAEMGVRVWLPAPATEAASASATAVLAAARDADATVPTAQTPSAPAARPAVEPARRTVPPTPTAPAALPPAAAPIRAPATPSAVATLDWDALQDAVASCQACGLCQGRKNTVFGTGSRQARWLVVGEAPGEQEDLRGEPFVGQAGQLLDNMLRAIGLNRQAEDDTGVYIANVLKCRPPANRNPSPQEVAQCEPFLRRQVELLQPTVILALGRFAAQSLLQDSVPDIATVPLGRLRGQVHRYQGVPVIVSYHPAYLLRTPQDKGKAWADLCLARGVFAQSTA